ncbi:MAG: hypothetical protein ABSG33_02435 [Candidatus Bathyarchaeia archaeon]
MMPVSNKLTMLVFVLPSLFIVTVFGVTIYLYHNSFDASAILTAVSSLTSSIVVILLVWERLRSSLFKKLGYVQRHILSGLTVEFSPSEKRFLEKTETRKLRLDLEKYGKFIRLSLYPRGLPLKIDAYLLAYDEFYKRWTQISEVANRQISNCSERDFAEYMGLDLNYRGGLQGDLDKLYSSVSKALLMEKPQLSSEMKSYFEKCQKLQKEILDQLEEFSKSNSIETESSSRNSFNDNY